MTDISDIQFNKLRPHCFDGPSPVAEKKNKIVVFDLEIKNSIDKKNIGWRDYDKMGISVGCAVTHPDLSVKIFMDYNLLELVGLLESADVVCGFNICGFDINLLEATVGRPLKLKCAFDILKEARSASGLGLFEPGFKLNNLLAGTFGPESTKIADGAEAPLMWQRGEIGRLLNYCIDDTVKEFRLLQYIIKNKKIKSDVAGEVAMGKTDFSMFGFLNG